MRRVLAFLGGALSGGAIGTAAALLLVCAGCARHTTYGYASGSEDTAFSAAIDIYQGPLNHLSAVRRGQCPMYPSCSQYSREAVAKHGALMGWVMGMDRLMRCGRSELSAAPLIQINGKWRYYDPVADNDFWWYRKGMRAQGQIFSTRSP